MNNKFIYQRDVQVHKSNRCVFRARLNESTDWQERIVDGNLFHSCGAATENARSAYAAVLASLTGGRSRRGILSADDRRHRVGLWMMIKFLIYCGAIPWMALNVSRRSLNKTRFLMGSQWRDRRTGVIWTCPRTLVTSLAAEFCTLWSLWIVFSGKP